MRMYTWQLDRQQLQCPFFCCHYPAPPGKLPEGANGVKGNPAPPFGNALPPHYFQKQPICFSACVSPIGRHNIQWQASPIHVENIVYQGCHDGKLKRSNGPPHRSGYRSQVKFKALGYVQGVAIVVVNILVLQPPHPSPGVKGQHWWSEVGFRYEHWLPVQSID